MARSLIRQLEQIRNAETYDDAIASANTAAVAEPVGVSSLEADTNVLRTIMKQVKGTANWYDSLGTYFDPTDTDAVNAQNKELTMSNISGHTLDAKTIITAVTDDNSGAGYALTGSETGVLLTSSVQYATAADRLGLPIFESASNPGSYFDEGGSDNVCRIDVINVATGGEFEAGGHTVYAKFVDGADSTGTGDGTDVYAKFYANGVAIDRSSFADVDAVGFVYPVRKRLTDMQEYDWQRTDFVSSWEGDVELIEDIANLWSYTGAVDGVTDPTWTDTAASFILSSNPTDLKSAIDLLNTGIGDRVYTEGNFITTGQTITESLDLIDQEIQDIYDSLDANVGEKYLETVASEIAKNTAHTLPYGLTYTPEGTSGIEGKNMDVYVDGQLLAADSGVNGANADRDYAETSATEITFRFKVHADRNITYVIRS